MNLASSCTRPQFQSRQDKTNTSYYGVRAEIYTWILYVSMWQQAFHKLFCASDKKLINATVGSDPGDVSLASAACRSSHSLAHNSVATCHSCVPACPSVKVTSDIRVHARNVVWSNLCMTAPIPWLAEMHLDEQPVTVKAPLMQAFKFQWDADLIKMERDLHNLVQWCALHMYKFRNSKWAS